MEEKLNNGHIAPSFAKDVSPLQYKSKKSNTNDRNNGLGPPEDTTAKVSQYRKVLFVGTLYITYLLLGSVIFKVVEGEAQEKRCSRIGLKIL